MVQWLYRGWHLNDEIAQLNAEIIQEREKAENIVAALSGISVSSSTDPHAKYDRIMINIERLSNLTLELVCRKIYILGELGEAIDSVSDPNCRILLRKRFIDCKSWRRITAEMHFSESQIKRIRKKALRLVEPYVSKKMTL